MHSSPMDTMLTRYHPVSDSVLIPPPLGPGVCSAFSCHVSSVSFHLGQLLSLSFLVFHALGGEWVQSSLCRMILNLAHASYEEHHGNDVVLSTRVGACHSNTSHLNYLAGGYCPFIPFVFDSYFVGRYSKITIIPVLVRPPSTYLSHHQLLPGPTTIMAAAKAGQLGL